MHGRELIPHPVLGKSLTLESLAAAADVHPRLVECFVAYGLVEPLGSAAEAPQFDTRAVRRLRVICRLRADLGINLPGIGVVLDLLDRLEAARRDSTRAAESR